MIAAILANIHRRPGTKAFELKDFMPMDDSVPEKRMSAEAIREAFMSMVKAGKKRKAERERRRGR